MLPRLCNFMSCVSDVGMSLGPAVPAQLGVVPQLFRPVMPQTAVPAAPKPIMEDEPPSKRAKNEDSLIPEDHWLAQRPVSTVSTFSPSL